MMEPTTTTAAAWAAALSSVTLAAFGMDYYSLLYGLVGAMMAMHSAEAMPRLRAVLFVVLCTLVGAALGNAAIALGGMVFGVQALQPGATRALLILGCVVGGYGAQAILARLLGRALERVDALANGTAKPPPEAGSPGGKP